MEIVKKPRNRKLEVAIWIFTVVVFGLVASLDTIPKPEIAPSFTKALPTVNATLNFTCFLVLISSLIMIKRKNITMHGRLNTFAMILSVCFLLSYVTYHITNENALYGGEYKGLYLFVLFSHIFTSGISLPFIIFSYYRAWIGDVDRHRKLVRFAYPVWLYVALTGPLVYLFLSPYYR